MNKLPPPPESGRKTRQCEVTRQWLEQQQLFDHSELPQTYPLVNIPTESTNVSKTEIANTVGTAVAIRTCDG